MAIPHAKAGEVVHVQPLGAALAKTITHTIVKTDQLEVIRIVLRAGSELPTHQVPGEITVQCVEGKVAFTIGDVTRELRAGALLYVEGGGAHSVRASEDSSLLVTILLKNKT
jgi:quercetin dioxygenase-like cupin family protein